MERIKERFLDDHGAVFERRDSGGLLVQNGAPDFRFHRRWGWWRSGYVGMAATLPDLFREGAYSAADMTVDVVASLRLASLIGGKGRARLRFGNDPRLLRAEFDLSDQRARQRGGCRIGGVQTVGRSAMTQLSSFFEMEFATTLEELAADAHVVAAQVVVPVLKEWHLARIDTTAFAASIPDLVEAARVARTL